MADEELHEDDIIRKLRAKSSLRFKLKRLEGDLREAKQAVEHLHKALPTLSVKNNTHVSNNDCSM